MDKVFIGTPNLNDPGWKKATSLNDLINIINIFNTNLSEDILNLETGVTKLDKFEILVKLKKIRHFNMGLGINIQGEIDKHDISLTPTSLTS